MSDALVLAAAAKDAPDRIAWIDDGGALTYAELARVVRQQASLLRDAGMAPGDRMLVTPSLDRASAVVMLAALELRTTLVLAHPAWSESELAWAIELARPQLIVRRGAIERSMPRADHAETPAVVVFTSGTTGRPKGVCLSRGALVAAARAHAEALPWREGDRWLLAMPLAHVGGLGVLARCIAARRTVVLGPPRFDPAALLDAIARYEITLLSLVPTMLERILPESPPPSVRAVLLGGAACPPALLGRGRSAGWPLLPTYGLSECCAQVCTQRLEDLRPDGVGPPLPGLQVCARDGEILVRGPTRMDGFLGEPLMPEAHWYRTGDAGFLDAEGHLHVTGRLDDRIVSGGENVDPLAVESALVEHRGVLAACVVGVDDPRWGQRVAALIIPRDPRDPPAPEALRAHLEPRLARYAWPRDWAFSSAIPLTRSGKPDRRAARSVFGSDRGQE